MHAARPSNHVKSTFGVKFGWLRNLHLPNQEPPREQQLGLPVLSRTQSPHFTRVVIVAAVATVCIVFVVVVEVVVAVAFAVNA